MARSKFYIDDETPVVSPLILTRCHKCGHEFWRTRYRMDLPCSKCGEKLHLTRDETAGENPV